MPHIVIVGGGIAGLAAAWTCVREGLAPQAPAPRDPLRVTLVEATPRFGGKIATERTGGFLIEGGADSFAGRKPRGVGLVRELGLEGSLIPTGSGRPRGTERPERPGRGGVYLATGGRLVPLPDGLSLVVPTRAGPLLRSPLLSARGKLRVGLDLVLPRRRSHSGSAPDESVADFVRRRFGGEYLERIAGPLLGGIHSTDPEVLSIAAAFPHLAAIERRHRSLLLGVRRGNGERSRTPAGPRRSRSDDTAAARVSLAGGMGELVDALVVRLKEAGADLRPSTPVAGLEAGPAGHAPWTVHLDGAPSLHADALMLATPPPVTADLLDALDPRLAAPLRSVPQVSTATVSLGLPLPAGSGATGGLRGMGFLVPRSEGRLVSACTFSSLKFPGRAPDGHLLLRAFVGGAGNWQPAVPPGRGDDDSLIALVRAELAELLGLERGLVDALRAEPVVARVHRFVEANPQYRVGHPERIRALEAALPRGLVLAGCAYHGIGIPDCIASGERAARAVLDSCRDPRLGG